MIRAQGLGKRFGERTAVEGVSFEVAAGEVFGLLGPNGGGKTTTMRMLAGLLLPTSGTARIGGRDLWADADARRQLGFLTEAPGLYDRLSAAENLAYFARLYEVPEPDVASRVKEALALFGLADRGQDLAGTYSKGMRQRLALARAMLHRPQALLLDEPTSGLDPEAAANVRDVIRDAAGRGLAVIVSTHNLAEAERLCGRVAVVKNRLLALVEDVGRPGEAMRIRADGVDESHAAGAGALPGVESASLDGAELAVHARAGSDAVPEVVAWLVARGLKVRQVVPARHGLEERYLALVGARSLADDVGAVG